MGFPSRNVRYNASLRIDHVGIVVDNLGVAGQFLAGVLGLELTREVSLPEGIEAAFYRCGEVSIEVIEVLDPDQRSMRLPYGSKARIEHIALEVDDLDRTVADLRAKGVQTTAGEARRVGPTDNYWTQADTSDDVQYQFFKRVGNSQP